MSPSRGYLDREQAGDAESRHQEETRRWVVGSLNAGLLRSDLCQPQKRRDLGGGTSSAQFRRWFHSRRDSFFFNDTATTEIYTLSLHDALPIWTLIVTPEFCCSSSEPPVETSTSRSEEHTSELQSRRDLVCRLLLEKKKKT